MPLFESTRIVLSGHLRYWFKFCQPHIFITYVEENQEESRWLPQKHGCYPIRPVPPCLGMRQWSPPPGRSSCTTPCKLELGSRLQIHPYSTHTLGWTSSLIFSDIVSRMLQKMSGQGDGRGLQARAASSTNRAAGLSAWLRLVGGVTWCRGMGPAAGQAGASVCPPPPQ